MKKSQPISKLNEKAKKSANLLKKVDNSIGTHKKDDFFKTPKVLYESDWIGSQTDEASEIGKQVQFIPQDGTGSVIKGDDSPALVRYFLGTDINISEEYLPFVKSSIIIKSQPKLQGHGIWRPSYTTYDFDYHRIKGDSTIIYKGKSPTARHFTQDNIDDGDVVSNMTSSWYYGTIAYTLAGTSYVLYDAYVVDTLSSWDYDPNTGYYKSFRCPALDNLYSTSVTGTGTYVIYNATPSTTRNITITAPLMNHSTSIHASGRLYINGVYDQTYTIDSPYNFIFINGNVPSQFDVIKKNYKLFYSTKRAKEFRIIDNTLENFPTTTYYQTGVLPYSKLYVDVNFNGYPESYKTNYASTLKSEQEDGVWIKKETGKYIYQISGKFYISLPNELLVPEDVTFVDEDYSQNGGTYLKDSENRPDKSIPRYKMSSDFNLELKLLLTLNIPKDYSSTESYDLQK